MAKTVTKTRQDIIDQASGVAKDLHEAGASTRQLASDSVDALRDLASEYVHQRRARMRKLGDSMNSRVREKPIVAVLTAAAIGFLLGAFWSRL